LNGGIPFVSKLTWLLAVPLVQMIGVSPIAAAMARTRSLDTRMNKEKRTRTRARTRYHQRAA
jgi:hypothetical protein